MSAPDHQNNLPAGDACQAVACKPAPAGSEPIPAEASSGHPPASVGRVMSADPDDDPTIPHDPAEVLRQLEALCKLSLAGGCRVSNASIQGRGISTPGMLLQIAGWIVLGISLLVPDVGWAALAIMLWLGGRWLWKRQGWVVNRATGTLDIFHDTIPLARLRPDLFGMLQIRKNNFWVHFAWQDKTKLLICFSDPTHTARFCRLFLRFCECVKSIDRTTPC